jgi:hypothetical protein
MLAAKRTEKRGDFLRDIPKIHDYLTPATFVFIAFAQEY